MHYGVHVGRPSIDANETEGFFLFFFLFKSGEGRGK